MPLFTVFKIVKLLEPSTALKLRFSPLLTFNESQLTTESPLKFKPAEPSPLSIPTNPP